MGAGDTTVMLEIGKERDRLQSLAEALCSGIVSPNANNKGGKLPHHLVGEDAVQAVVMKRHHPVEALELIRPHGTVDDWSRSFSSRLAQNASPRTWG
jgi:hypothetical protein